MAHDWAFKTSTPLPVALRCTGCGVMHASHYWRLKADVRGWLYECGPGGKSGAAKCPDPELWWPKLQRVDLMASELCSVCLRTGKVESK